MTEILTAEENSLYYAAIFAARAERGPMVCKYCGGKVFTRQTPHNKVANMGVYYVHGRGANVADGHRAEPTTETLPLTSDQENEIGMAAVLATRTPVVLDNGNDNYRELMEDETLSTQARVFWFAQWSASRNPVA